MAKKKLSFKTQILQSIAPKAAGKRVTGSESFTPTQAPRKPDPVALPFNDPAYLAQTAGYRLPYEQALARLPGDVGTLASDYGFSVKHTDAAPPPTPGAGDDPNDPRFLPGAGTYEVTGVDTSNPYSRAALLQRSYDQSRAGNQTSYAARGQGYSGALVNAQAAAKTGFDTGSNQLRGAFNDVIRGWLGNLGAQGGQFGTDRGQALGGAVGRQAENPPPATYGGVGYQANKQGFLAPLSTPTAKSVSASGSLLGTRLAPTYFKPPPVYKPKKPKR